MHESPVFHHKYAACVLTAYLEQDYNQFRLHSDDVFFASGEGEEHSRAPHGFDRTKHPFSPG